jgi:hypothetical protein
LSPILFKLYRAYLTKTALEGSGDFETRGQVIHTAKYADDFIMEEMVVQGVNDRQIEIGGCCGMGRIMRISRLPPPIQTATSKRTGECGTFHIFG